LDGISAESVKRHEKSGIVGTVLSLWERANDDLPSLRAKGQKVLLPK
jgi:hypothetical protein